MLRSSNDLLALSQFDHGRQTLQRKRLDFSDLVIELEAPFI
jgi:signal transduction histidine kinase